MKHLLKTTLALLALNTSLATADEIKVGMLEPYTGVYAALGKEIDDGFMLGLETFGAEAKGHTFKIIREDTEAKPPVGLAKTKKLILQDEVHVLTGIVSSGVVAAVRDLVNTEKVPLIISNAGNNEVTGEACSPYITRFSFSNAQINRPMGKWLFDKGVKKVYVVAPDYAAGKQMIGAFTETFKAAGGEVVGEEYTPFQKVQDFGPYLTNAKASGAQAVYAFYAGGEAISFVKQYDSFGLKANMPLYGYGSLTSQLYVNAEGPAAEGVVTALQYVPTIDSKENKDFVAAFKTKTGHLPSEFAVQGYDSARALVEAVKTGATTREAIAAALPKVTFTGPRGPLSIDPATNNIIQSVYVYETVKGTDGMTQKVLATFDKQQDPVNGCKM